MTNQEIKTVGQTIAQETQIGGNTAARVGGVVEGIGVALDNKDAANGYYQATISGGTVTVNAPNYLLGTGGNLRIKMPSEGTTASTLTIGNANAVQLWYNGAAVSSDNTWEAKEIISVFYDGTRFMASNSQGGGGKAEKISYDNSQSGLTAENVQGGLDETIAQLGLVTHISSITPTWSNGNIHPDTGLNVNAQSSLRTSFMDADILKVSCDSGYFIKGVFAYNIRDIANYHGTLYYGSDGNNWDTSKQEVIIPCKDYAVRITIGRTDLSSISTTESSHIKVENLKYSDGGSVISQVNFAKNGLEEIDYSAYIMTGCGLGLNGNWRTGLGNVDCAVIPCMGNTYYKLKAAGDTFGRYSFFVNNILVSDSQAPFCEGYSGNGVRVEVGDTVTVKSPNNARYLYITFNSAGSGTTRVDSHFEVTRETDFFNYAEKNYIQDVGNITNPSENITINGQGSTTAISSYIPCKPNTRYIVMSDKQQWEVPSPTSTTSGFRISEHKDSSSSSYWTAVRYTQAEIAGSPIPEKIYFTTQDQTNYIRISIAAIVGVEINVSIAQAVDVQSMDDAISYQEIIQPVVIGNYTGERIVLDESLTYQKTKFMQFNEDKLIFQSMDFCESNDTKYGIFLLKPYDNEIPYGYLYDMSRRMKMQDISFPIPSGYSLCHANASFFLKDNYYDENSVLPMFAINMWQSEKVVFIYDFNEESLTDEYGNSYTSVKPILRYTIEPDSSIRNLGTYIDFISDDTQTYLWALGWTMNCYKFPFPNLESGTTTTIGDFTFKKSVLNYSDRIENFSVGTLNSFQDKCYANGKIFVTYGEVSEANPLAIAVIDTVEKVRSNTIDLSCDMRYAKYRIPYVQNRETQGLAVLDSHLMLTYWKENVLWQFTL